MFDKKKQEPESIDQETAGYLERQLWTYSPDKEATVRIELILPNTPDTQAHIDDSYRRATTLEWQARQARDELC